MPTMPSAQHASPIATAARARGGPIDFVLGSSRDGDLASPTRDISAEMDYFDADDISAEMDGPIVGPPAPRGSSSAPLYTSSPVLAAASSSHGGGDGSGIGSSLRQAATAVGPVVCDPFAFDDDTPTAAAPQPISGSLVVADAFSFAPTPPKDEGDVGFGTAPLLAVAVARRPKLAVVLKSATVAEPPRPAVPAQSPASPPAHTVPSQPIVKASLPFSLVDYAEDDEPGDTATVSAPAPTSANSVPDVPVGGNSLGCSDALAERGDTCRDVPADGDPSQAADGTECSGGWMQVVEMDDTVP